jgi:hypothetical protein
MRDQALPEPAAQPNCRTGTSDVLPTVAKERLEKRSHRTRYPSGKKTMNDQQLMLRLLEGTTLDWLP